MRIRFPTTLAILFVLLWIKAIYPPASGIADTDFYWHLEYGRWIVEHLSIPAGDIFSWTFFGHPYQLTQWLGEAAMGLTYNLGGLSGTKALSISLTGITFYFAWIGARRYVDRVTAFLLAISCNLVQVVTPMRPQLFSFACLAIACYLIVSYLTTQRLRFLLFYPLLMMFWVNLHGGFVVGLLLLGLMGIGMTIEAYMGGKYRDCIRRLLTVWGIVLTSTLATLINPYGYKALAIVAMIADLRSSSVITEWLPVNLMSELGWFYLLNLVPYVSFMVISGCKPRLTEGLIAGVFLIFGVMANRQVAMCAAVMAPLSAALLARTPNYKKIRADICDTSRPLFYGVISALMIAIFPFLSGKANINWDNTLNLQYPLNATEFLIKHDLTHKVMSDTLEASYLIHRGIPVFIDGRMDLYRDRFYFEWYLASRAASGWNSLIEKHQPEAMLLRIDMAIRQTALASGKWKQIYQDERYSVLVPENNQIPSVPIRDVTYLDPEGRAIRPYMP